MGELTDWIKTNAVDGADISKAEGLIERLSIDNIDSKEKALDFIKKNDMLLRGLDLHTTESIKNHDLKFNTDKLPSLLEAEREKIKTELNPPKTEAEKQLAKVMNTLNEMKLKETKSEIEKSLRLKSKELSYPEEDCERFSIYGENAIDMLARDAERMHSQVNARLESEIKTRYGDNPQPTRTKPINPKSMDEQIQEARQSGNTDLAMKLLIQTQQPQQ